MMNYDIIDNTVSQVLVQRNVKTIFCLSQQTLNGLQHDFGLQRFIMTYQLKFIDYIMLQNTSSVWIYCILTYSLVGSQPIVTLVKALSFEL